MEIHVLSLFPGVFSGFLEASILKRAQERETLRVMLHDIRDFTTDRHRTADDYPFGGGPGMVMKPEPIFAAVEHASAEVEANLGPDVRAATPVVLLSPQGQPFSQRIAAELASHTALILICGHYEGVDGRVEEHLATRTLSIGDYVLTGGELPALIVIDAIARLLPGVLGDAESAANDSFADGLLEGPQYTRPANFRGLEAPPVLLSGDHGAVARWRRRQALLWTWQRRPDLLSHADLSAEDNAFLDMLKQATGSGLHDPE